MPSDNLLLIRFIFHLSNFYLEERNKLLKQFDVRETLFISLLAIYCQPEQKIQPSMLSYMLGSSRTNITRLSDELVKKDCVKRIPYNQDRRVYFLQMTDKGMNFLEGSLPIHRNQLNSLFSILDADEKTELMRLLLKLSHNFEALGKETS